MFWKVKRLWRKHKNIIVDKHFFIRYNNLKRSKMFI